MTGRPLSFEFRTALPWLIRGYYVPLAVLYAFEGPEYRVGDWS